MSDEKADRPETRKTTPPSPRGSPGAGPHARKDLTNYEATPGAGSLPGEDEDDSQDTVSS